MSWKGTSVITILGLEKMIEKEHSVGFYKCPVYISYPLLDMDHLREDYVHGYIPKFNIFTECCSGLVELSFLFFPKGFFRYCLVVSPSKP